MTEHHRMVAAWTKSFDEAKIAPRAPLRDPHGSEEIFAAEMRRATEGHQRAAGRDRAHRERVELDVKMSGAQAVLDTARKGRRIDNHDREFSVIRSKIFERVLLD